MSRRCKPCEQEPTEKSYLMVEATAASANDCGDPQATASPLGDCVKQEPVYDVIHSSFIVPEPGFDISVQVCNNTIYAVNQFLEFLGYDGLRMRIITIDADGKTMALQNGCANGAFIINNPLAGLAVSIHSQFIPVDTPACTTQEEADETLQQGLSTATALCVPVLAEPESDTVVYQMVARTESDPSDTSLKKCIKRVKNFFFSLGAPRCPAITLLDEADNFSYRNVAAEKTTGQFKTRRLIGEAAGTVAGFKYIEAGTKTAQKSVGPAYIYSPFIKLFEESGTLTDETTYVSQADGVTFSKDFSVNIAEINGLLNKDLQDHYYLNLHLIVGAEAASAGQNRFLQVKINDELVMVISGRTSGFTSHDSIVIPVKIMNIDTTFNFKLVATGNNIARYYKIRGLGAFI